MPKKMKSLLPKRIGKVKIGKSTRKGALADFLSSKAGQVLIAEALMAAGTLAAAKLKDNPKVRGAVATAKTKGVKAGHDAKEAISYAVGEAMRSFSDALHRPPADRQPAADPPAWSPLEPAPVAKSARPRTRRATPPNAPPA